MRYVVPPVCATESDIWTPQPPESTAFAWMSEPRDDDAVAITALVFAFIDEALLVIAEAIDEVAVWRSLSVAREPSPRMPAMMSLASPLIEEMVRDEKFQTAAGIALIAEASEDDAAVTMVFVLAFTTDAMDEDAVATRVSVFAFTADVIPEVCVFVFAFMSATTDDEALCRSETSARVPTDSAPEVSVRVP